MGEYAKDFLEKMQKTYLNLAGIRADDASDVGIRFKILADLLEEVQKKLDFTKQQSFPKTATGTSLELHAEQRGLTRKPALFAAGEAEFRREHPAEEDILIPEGVLLGGQGMESLKYITCQDAVMKRGENAAVVPIRCQIAGSQGNLAANQLRVMVTPVPGIAQVNNPKPLISGRDAESDEELRTRLMDSYRFVTNGTNSAFYYNQAMRYPEVSSAKILPRVNGAGTVGIIVHGAAIDEAFLEKMKAEIGAVKEINVNLTVEKAQEKPLGISVEIAAADGYSYEDVSVLCKEAVEHYFHRQKVGQPLYMAPLIREILSCEGIANGKIISPVDDLYPSDREIYTLAGCSVSQIQRI